MFSSSLDTLIKDVQDDISSKTIRIWLRNAVESRVNVYTAKSPQSEHLCTVVRSFPRFVFLWPRIFGWLIKNQTIFLEIFFNETQKWKINRTIHISMARALNSIQKIARFLSWKKKRHFDHNCLITRTHHPLIG